MAVSPTKAQYGSSPWKYTQITEPFVSQTPKSEHKNRYQINLYNSLFIVILVEIEFGVQVMLIVIILFYNMV